MTSSSRYTAQPQPSESPLEPAWDIARLFPPQGHWTQGDYFALETNHLVEFADGSVKVLEMPTPRHQLICGNLVRCFGDFVRQHSLGQFLFAPVPLMLWPERIREPDLLFIATAHLAWIQDTHCTGADLVMEILSTDRQHDLVTKRAEYARAGIPEYWIVDPQEQSITVLSLDGDAYREHGKWGPGQTVESSSLAGFAVAVDEVFES